MFERNFVYFCQSHELDETYSKTEDCSFEIWNKSAQKSLTGIFPLSLHENSTFDEKLIRFHGATDPLTTALHDQSLHKMKRAQ